MDAKKDVPVPVLIRVPRALLKKVDAEAKRSDRSRSFLAVEALRSKFAAKAAKAVKS